MTTALSFSQVLTRLLLTTGLFTIAALALPAFANAATYAYVNVAGEVSTVTADTANSALLTAPNLAVHSGVMLLLTPTDNEVVGDQVSGV